MEMATGDRLRVPKPVNPAPAWSLVMAMAKRTSAVGFFSYLTANFASVLISHFKSREAGAER